MRSISQPLQNRNLRQFFAGWRTGGGFFAVIGSGLCPIQHTSAAEPLLWTRMTGQPATVPSTCPLSAAASTRRPAVSVVPFRPAAGKWKLGSTGKRVSDEQSLVTVTGSQQVKLGGKRTAREVVTVENKIRAEARKR